MRKYRIVAILALFLLVVSVPAWAAPPANPVGSFTLSVPSTGAVSLPNPVINGKVSGAAIVWNTGTQTIHFWLDGTAPTTSTGFVLYPGDSYPLITPAAVTKFQGIAGAGTGALSGGYFQ